MIELFENFWKFTFEAMEIIGIMPIFATCGSQ
jgi:hypothetical protein